MALILGNNLVETLIRRVEAGPGRTAMLKRNHGVWVTVTWREYERRVFEISEALKREGVRPGDKVAILSQTRPEWAFTDLAVMSLGAVTVPVYPSVTADDIHYILSDAEVKFAFIEGSAQREKIETLRLRLPDLKGVISYSAPPPHSGVFDFETWVKASSAESDAGAEALARWRQEAMNIERDAMATIVYTSGTEGSPKGVSLTHANFLEVMRDAAAMIKIGEQDTTLIFLPVAHIIGRIEQMLALGVGWTNAYSQGQGSLMDNLLEVRPTILFGVPRIFEKIREGSLNAESERTAQLKDWLNAWAMGAGHKFSHAQVTGENPGLVLKAQHAVLDRLVFSKVRKLFGGRLRFAISGGAPLPQEVAEFFHACGVLLLEGYGLTETTGPISFNTPQSFRFGTVGKLFPSVEVKFSEEGEILLRGPSISKGYAGKSVSAAPRARDAWLLTGDIGTRDAQGFLHITDRKKDLIITSGGKNIAPLKIENQLRSIPLLSNVLLAGDRRNYITAIFTINIEQARFFCEKNNIPFRGLADLTENEVFQKHLKAAVNEVNVTLASYEQIKRFKVLTRDFSIEAGELTPSHKVKRAFCIRKYVDLIEEMYQ